MYINDWFPHNCLYQRFIWHWTLRIGLASIFLIGITVSGQNVSTTCQLLTLLNTLIIMDFKTLLKQLCLFSLSKEMMLLLASFSCNWGPRIYHRRSPVSVSPHIWRLGQIKGWKLRNLIFIECSWEFVHILTTKSCAKLMFGRSLLNFSLGLCGLILLSHF
jgi:hypothetical protein